MEKRSPKIVQGSSPRWTGTLRKPLTNESPNMADESSNQNVSDKDWTTLMIVSFFLGGLGVHRFMVGKTGSGVAMLLTLGGCGFWALYDFIMIALGKFTDAEGRLIVQKK